MEEGEKLQKANSKKLEAQPVLYKKKATEEKRVTAAVAKEKRERERERERVCVCVCV
jgi:hypothetical protein